MIEPNATIKVLIVDDSPADAEICLVELRRTGLTIEERLATDEAELRAVLSEFAPDIIICDYHFPDFDGLRARTISQELRPNTPLIFLSGSLSETDFAAILKSGAADFVIKSKLARLPSALERAIRESRERKALERSLHDAEERTGWQAKRLDALWTIINTPNLSGQDLVLAMLSEAASAMRPDQIYAATLGHVEGQEYVLDALSSKREALHPAARSMLPIGLRLPLSETLIVRDLAAGRTQWWDDCQILPNLPARPRAAGVRSQIMTQFTANGMVYVLTLGSLDPPSATPFGPKDIAYIEILGSFFAHRLELEQLVDSLAEAELRSRNHAERLEALWQIANNTAFQGNELLFAMLRQGAAALRPPQLFRAVLGRIEGGEVITVAIGIDPADADPRASMLKVGRRSRLEQTIIPRGGRTQAWSDLQALDDMPAGVVALGWRAAISTQFNAGTSRYSMTFASPEAAATPFDAADLGYIDVLASSIAKQLVVNQLEDSLREEEEQSRRHAERLETLWSIVNNPSLRDTERLLAMLRQGAASIRPRQEYRGILWRIEGSEIVVEATAAPDPLADGIHNDAGARLPLEQTIFGRVVADGGGTHYWDDLQSSDYATPLTAARNTHSLIVTMFTAGATNWALSFSSVERTEQPLGSHDKAFIEVLASFFANHVQQRWQFERIEYQQSHDVLTGLLNRSQFRSQARAAARTSSRYAVVLIDISAFREINESYGHMIGDALLVEVAHALRMRLSGAEIVGRIGGDVFGIFVPNHNAKEAVLRRAHDFATVFVRPFSTGDAHGTEFIALNASLGIAVAPDDGSSIDAILLHADVALASAKGRGHGSLVFYDPGMEGDAHRRTALRNELTEAIAHDQFELYYQPHIEISGGAVTGCEALIRWNHPTRGLLLPGHFIPFAEESGIITSIDEWVMRNAFAAANMLSAGRPGFRLYFNLSGRQAGDPKLIHAFVDAARSGVALKHIGVEITETDAMRDVEATRHVCRALRRLDVSIAVDDFGTGYSSLSSLKRLPVDIVKIDRSFVSGVLTDPHDETIAETIISIADRFGFESLAEGVEDEAELMWLQHRACRYAQGYAICHPLPLGDFMTWLEARPAGHGEPSCGPLDSFARPRATQLYRSDAERTSH